MLVRNSSIQVRALVKASHVWYVSFILRGKGWNRNMTLSDKSRQLAIMTFLGVSILTKFGDLCVQSLIMSVKETVDLPRWQRLGNAPLRFVVPRVLIAMLIVSALLFFWTSHPQYRIRASSSAQTSEEQVWIDDPTEYREDVPPKGPEQPVHTNGLLPLDEAEALCAQHKMKPYPHRDQPRKVYDLFLIGTELSWAEIRLNELASSVDYFVILEADKTFTNKTKPTFFKNNWNHFAKFGPQIIYRLLDDEAIQDYGAWDREHYQRDALVTQIFPSLLGDQAPNMGDVIIVSDVDEIPRPETIGKLRNCDIPERTGMESKFFLYSFNWHRTDSQWFHPQATYWQGEKTILPESLRMTQTEYEFMDAAWHCTTCFSSVKELVTKVRSFSHQEWNQPEFTDPEAIVNRVRNGIDVFDRGFTYEKVPDDEIDVPTYLLQHKQKFAYLLTREPENANFRDYVPMLDEDGYNVG